MTISKWHWGASAAVMAIGLLGSSVASAQSAPLPGPNQPESVPDTQAQASDEIIVVTGIRAALESSANKKREAGNIKDVITAEDIGKFPDENVADSLARVTGVQITRDIGEGSDFTIRGISQNRVEVNGRTTIGRGEDRNANIGDISADLLGGLEVIKSPTADLVEGSLGGTVNLITRRAFDFRKPSLSLNLRQGYTTNAKKYSPNLNVLATDRWNTGIGEFGALVNASYSVTSLSEDRANLNGWNAACNYDIDRDGKVSTARPTDTDNDGVDDTCPVDQDDFVFRPTNTALVDTQTERKRLGVVLSLQWRPSSNLEFYFDGDYTTYQDKEFKYAIFSGAVAPGTALASISNLEIDDNRNATSITFTGLRPQTSSQTTVRDSKTYSFAAGGRWVSGNLTSTGEYSRSTGDGQDYALYLTSQTIDANGIVAIKQDGDLFSINYDDQITGAENFRILEYNNFYNFIDSTEQAGRLDFDYALNRGILSVFEFGTRVTRQDFNKDRTRYFSLGRPNPLRQKPFTSVPQFNGLAADAPLGGFFGGFSNVTFPKSWFQFVPSAALNGVEPFRASFGAPVDVPHVPDEEYFLDERTAAAYGKMNVEGTVLGLDFRGNAGVRYVYSKIEAHTDIADLNNNLTPRDESKSYGNWLPSANLTVDVGNNLLTRFAYAKTMVRPSFAQLRPTVQYVFTTGNGVTDPFDAAGGNPTLNPFEATQYDISIEKYFGRGNLLSLAFYYRDVGAFIRKRIIQNVTLPNGLLVDLTVPENGANATVKGAEAGVQYAFDFLPGALNGFGVFANYTYSDSKTPDRDRFGNRLQLEGLSKHAYNASVFYEKYGVAARLSYNWRGRRLLTAIGQAGRPEYQTPDEQLDLSTSWDVNSNFRVSFDARNLTRRLGRQYNETFNAPTRIFYEDTKYTIGVRAKF